MKPLVYVETSIFSFYFDERSSPLIAANRYWTREWWDEKRGDYDCVVGASVILELDRGGLPHRGEALALAGTLKSLAASDEAERIAAVYVAHRLMPADPLGDASHLALASLAGCDYLLTWNCRHLANANKFGHIETINRRLGLAVRHLVTPQQLLGKNAP